MRLIFASLFFVFGFAVTVQAQEPTSAQLEAWEAYTKTIPIQEQWEGIVEGVTESAPPEMRPMLTDTLAAISLEKVEAIMKAAALKTYTNEELHFLAKVYADPIGRAALDKSGVYLAEAIPHLRPLIETAIADTMEKGKK